MRSACTILAAVVLTACRTSAPPKPATSVANRREAESCIAVRLGALRFAEHPLRADCRPGDTQCAEQCADGDGNACFNRALQLEMEDEAAAATLFERGCDLGDSLACVNHAAGLWSRATSREPLLCAERVLIKACEAGDHMGCGMRGRVLYDLVDSDAALDGVRDYLLKTCEDVPGFACRVLAYYLEAGAFGTYEPEWIPRLLERACDGGDPGGCGAPATASETFNSP